MKAQYKPIIIHWSKQVQPQKTRMRTLANDNESIRNQTREYWQASRQQQVHNQSKTAVSKQPNINRKRHTINKTAMQSSQQPWETVELNKKTREQ